MKKHVLAGLAAAISLPCAALSLPAVAQPDNHWHGDSGRHDWDPADHYDGHRHQERRMTREDQVYRGHDGRYYCRRNDGTTGLVVGALGGGALGAAIGGNTLGTLLGAGAGAAVGRAIDRGQVHCG